ncbi:sulfotransferase domain-containing protein [Bowmanella yangjiangensis]|uniref:Sulfotransferase n=1 Tax=Bowmanella yangjiangensis TaxID=2811230 RepID=A0ABS3CTQ6_9ALTE|nr:sulfotransferase [Bowmanella yangjiangensis]
MIENITLITGIPRSGTTLCCNLLNQRDDAVALHEPINPSRLAGGVSAGRAGMEIESIILQLREDIAAGRPFENGDKAGLSIDNPVGLSTKDGKRQVVAQRGLVSIPPRENQHFRLIVKQNALFTSLLTQLEVRFPIVAIVRNPVDVLLSWMTVDLPVNRGRVPAGERFSDFLRNTLLRTDSVFQRQLIIYTWFMQQFIEHELSIVRYEDVVASAGTVLDEALGFQALNRSPLNYQNRQFAPALLDELQSNLTEITKLSRFGLYSEAEIARAMTSAIGAGE